VYTERGHDEIQTGKIALKKELMNLKHKIIYNVKTISVHV
jgi:hypothetical protein